MVEKQDDLAYAFAVANPARYPGPGLDGLRFRVTGYTIVTCNRATRKPTIMQARRRIRV